MANRPNTTPPPSRRGFLCGLAALPLIGGSIALLGAPSAAAEPVSLHLLDAYRTWLHYEKRWLLWEMAGDPAIQARRCTDARWMGTNRRDAAVRSLEETGTLDHESRVYLAERLNSSFDLTIPAASYHEWDGSSQPSTRAALVLSTVGCAWKEAA